MLAWRGLAVAAAGALALGSLVRLLKPLPSLDRRRPGPSLVEAKDTRLRRAIAPLAAAHPGQSGLYLLVEGPTAFAARALAARAAERSIDAQYYMWHADLTGSLLLEELRAAAERGVRVRLLLDDANTAGLDALLTSLNGHPNAEVRLFNPFTIRRVRPLAWAVDFFRLNRRMHNKSFTIDNQITIVGGRNIGDEYFGTGQGSLLVDLDVLAVGPVVADVNGDFERYWSCAAVYPLECIVKRQPSPAISIVAAADQAGRKSEAKAFLEALRSLPIVQQLEENKLPLTWASVTMVSDNPDKALGRGGDKELLITKLRRTIGQPKRRLGLVSGYFVPTGDSLKTLTSFALKGVEVEVVTNAFEATDVPVVHVGYAGDRKPLLKAGVKLWEIRAKASGRPDFRKKLGIIGGGSSPGSGASGGVPQRPSQALHAKTFMVDHQRLFIGSFNLDPRSARLNTEMGLVIRSGELTQVVEDRLAKLLPSAAYELRIQSNGRLQWLERQGDTEIIHEVEPGTTALTRGAVGLLAKLPLEWLL